MTRRAPRPPRVADSVFNAEPFDWAKMTRRIALSVRRIAGVLRCSACQDACSTAVRVSREEHARDEMQPHIRICARCVQRMALVIDAPKPRPRAKTRRRLSRATHSGDPS